MVLRAGMHRESIMSGGQVLELTYKTHLSRVLRASPDTKLTTHAWPCPWGGSWPQGSHSSPGSHLVTTKCCCVTLFDPQWPCEAEVLPGDHKPALSPRQVPQPSGPHFPHLQNGTIVSLLLALFRMSKESIPVRTGKAPAAVTSMPASQSLPRAPRMPLHSLCHAVCLPAGSCSVY